MDSEDAKKEIVVTMDPADAKKLENRRILLNIDYRKLLSYLAGVLVFLILLFQITTAAKHLPWWVVLIMSIASLVGVMAFLYVSYHNYKEIIDLENKIGLSDSDIMESTSGLFSKRKNKDTTEREVSKWLKFFLGALLALSIFLVFASLKIMMAGVTECSVAIPE